MRKILTLIGALIAAPAISAAEDRKGAWIVAKPEAGIVTLEAYAVLENGEAGSYELSATKKGTAGSSVNKQSGKVRIADDGVLRPLSTSRISVEQGATLDVTLKVTSATGRVYETLYSFTGD
jgi:hypothetical protein